LTPLVLTARARDVRIPDRSDGRPGAECQVPVFALQAHVVYAPGGWFASLGAGYAGYERCRFVMVRGRQWEWIDAYLH
jgi:hypothetical protein